MGFGERRVVNDRNNVETIVIEMGSNRRYLSVIFGPLQLCIRRRHVEVIDGGRKRPRRQPNVLKLHGCNRVNLNFRVVTHMCGASF